MENNKRQSGPLAAPSANWEYLDQFAYNGTDLGSTYYKTHTTFKLWAPTASEVDVNLYNKGSKNEKNSHLISSHPMTLNINKNIWELDINGDLNGVYYTYSITIDGKTQETVDIYAKALGVNGDRGMVIDLKSTNPKGWKNDKRVMVDTPTKAIIWETHVKDFSIDASSGVSKEHRGKFLAFTEENTTLNNEGKVPTCLNHLKRLGVNYVHLLPIFDYATIDETKNSVDAYNWGYDPKNYNAPEGSYSTNPYDGAVRINELKQMIMALHKAGIGVIMDMVYNHTYQSKDSCFNKTVPNYYYRLNSDGTWSNGSGCGNDTASEHAMFRKYMIESVKYWAEEYHIDGFRFDLMGLHDADTMNQIRSALDMLKNGRKILMYGEAWDMFTAVKPGTYMANKSNLGLLSNRIAAFNDNIRDTIKGNTFDKYNRGFAQGCEHSNSLKAGVTANSVGYGWGWAKSPSQTVTYTSCHDNYALWDKLVVSMKGEKSDFENRDETILSMNKLTAAIILTSQGLSFFQAGEEFARNKKGEHNSYNLPTIINRINWNNRLKFRDLCDYYTGLIEIRKNFSPFTDNTKNSASIINFFNTHHSHVLAYHLENKIDPENNWKHVCVIFNSDPSCSKSLFLQTENIPSEWVIIADSKNSGIASLGELKNLEVNLPPSSAMILVDKKSFENANKTPTIGTVAIQHINTEDETVMLEESYKGQINTPYVTSKNSNFDVFYDLVKVEGAENSFFTPNKQTVKYYYKPCTQGIGTIITRYIDAETKQEIIQSKIVKKRIGKQYISHLVPEIENYELITDKLPTNSAGVLKDDVLYIDYYFKRVSPQKIHIKYKNRYHWEKTSAYIYNDCGNLRCSRPWPGLTMQHSKTDNDIWECEIDVSDLKCLHSPRVIFNDETGHQEPNLGEPGWFVKAENVMIENGIVNYSENTGCVFVLHLNTEGKILEKHKIYGSVDGITTYNVEPTNFYGYRYVKTSGDRQGTFSTNSKYVIFTYDRALN